MFSFVKQDVDFSHKLDYASSPKDQYSKHMHVFYELILFVRGDVDYHVEGETRHLESGDIILMSPGKFHFATVNKDVSYERYVFKFPVSFLPSSLQERLRNMCPFFPSKRNVESAVRAFDTFYDLYNDEDLYLLAKCKMQEIMVYLANSRGNVPEFQNNDIISVLIDYIENHIKEDLALENIAKDLHYSESYLSNQFKKAMKCSLMKYIRSKKIVLAQQMIREGRKAVDVAEELSFNDYSTFYRSYLKVTGMSPASEKENKR
ncbi:MAG: AraC family transcriptional regulator [Mollicutes bacterium]|nr:AraC family transcriptional regulator [Mollicutes bacterium]